MNELLIFDVGEMFTPSLWGGYKLPDNETLRQFVIDLHDAVNSFIDIPEDLRTEMIYVCYEWYGYYYTYGAFYSRENSLKNSLRILYRQYSKKLVDFGKFMEKIYAVFKKYSNPNVKRCSNNV